MTDRSSSTDLSTVIDAVAVPAAATSGRFVVTVVEGPEAGVVLELDASGTTRALVGQGPACGLRLSDPRVSRRHVALELQGRDLRITDLGSKNGTFVDGIQVMDALLHGGETIRLGGTALGVASGQPAVDPTPPRTSFGRYIGGSLAMRRLYPLCERLAASTIPIIIEGETGTGKEVMAEALHEVGPRAASPYVVFDCTSVAPSVVESELFGHEKGAFTGATSARKGMFELAHGGTLLIDEIGDLDLALQPKLLRVVERGEVRRVGGSRPVSVDVRVIAATRRDLDREVQAGRFRDDLYHRLAIGRLELPPLRQREGDVVLLARRFWAEQGGAKEALTGDILARLVGHTWPGNVRELRNTVARQLSLGDLAAPPRSVTSPSMAPAESVAASLGTLVDALLAEGLGYPRARQRVLAEFERTFVEKLLARHHGNTAEAAAASGIARRYFNVIRARRA